jgi:hypothetical protein
MVRTPEPEPAAASPDATAASPAATDEILGAEVSIRRIQVLNLCLVGVTSLGGLALSVDFFWGALAGGALMAASFGIIAAVIRSVFTKTGISPLRIGIYWAKFAGILLIVGALILVFRVDPLGLLAGLSTILVAITAEAVLRLAGK